MVAFRGKNLLQAEKNRKEKPQIERAFYIRRMPILYYFQLLYVLYGTYYDNFLSYQRFNAYIFRYCTFKICFLGFIFGLLGSWGFFHGVLLLALFRLLLLKYGRLAFNAHNANVPVFPPF